VLVSTSAGEEKSAIRYRAHIDGLRGIAIIAVVLYHAGFLTFASGGFVGVDIFFVISGFLITAFIDRDLRAGTFSLLSFWERRIRRIVPALTVMMIAVAIGGWFFILPIYTTSATRSRHRVCSPPTCSSW
jgi:peptidoglycan/LPS O-acetylase OafA/YrhL